MNEYTKKIIDPWLIIFLIIPGIRFPIVFIPIIIFTVIHFGVLQNQPLKFQRPTNELYRDSIALTLLPLLGIIAFYAYYYGLPIDNLLNQNNLDRFVPGLIILPFSIVTTIWSLIFSNFYFAKPPKETWKAILLAGIIAGLSGFALSYGLWKLVGPHLAKGL